MINTQYLADHLCLFTSNWSLASIPIAPLVDRKLLCRRRMPVG